MDNSNSYSGTVVPVIKNGSILSIGKETLMLIHVDQHFNLFQKLMWKWCFGVKIEDYKDYKQQYKIN